MFMFMFVSLSFAANDTCVLFFTGEGCPHCAVAHEHIAELEEKYENLTIKEYEVWYNQTNAQILGRLFDKYEISNGNLVTWTKTESFGNN